MPILDYARELAQRGFYVFPVQGNGKLPVVKDWPNEATRDERQIADWFVGADRNVGIATGKFGDGQALCVIDVDNKKGKSGDASLLELELQGCDFPNTMEVETPSGGRHLIYVVERALKQGVNVLGPGLDVRSRGGFIVGPGSQIDGRPYTLTRRMLPVPAPAWLVDRLGAVPDRPAADPTPLAGVDPDRAAGRAIEYLKTAPVSVEGEGGDITAYKVAAKLKDLGVYMSVAHDLMLEHWNERCDPPWTSEEIMDKVSNVWNYGREQPGVAAPEAVFDKAEPAPEDEGLHPFEVLNQTYAYVVQGDHVIWETVNVDGKPMLAHLNTENFHKALASQRIQMGEKSVPLTKAWMNHNSRRTFDGFVFAPEQKTDPRWYNLWRGFCVEPAASADHPSLTQFLDHTKDNVCGGDAQLFKWLIGFFAHMIQRPWEKPLVSLVFKGRKGTGKNALIERVGHLLGNHFMVTSKRRHLVGQFNGHLESCLCMTLDEAFWSGDKESEGVLKDLITGRNHVIEHKGKESFEVKNLTRIVIIGNEEWIVPVTHDERRFAVFTVGDGRRQDRKFFESMRVGMEQGGYAHLLRYLLDFDLSQVDVNGAPRTQGLVEQMHASLEPLDAWWLDCLAHNRLAGDSFEGDFPERIPVPRLYTAFETWVKKKNIRSRLPRDRDFNKVMTVRLGKYRRTRDGNGLTYAYYNPGIDVLRAEWEQHVGGKVDWE